MLPKSIRGKICLFVLVLSLPLTIVIVFSEMRNAEAEANQAQKSTVQRGMNRLASEWQRLEFVPDDREIAAALAAGGQATIFDERENATWRSSDRSPATIRARGTRAIVLRNGTLVYYMLRPPEETLGSDLRAWGAIWGLLALVGLSVWFVVSRALRPLDAVVAQVRQATAAGTGVVEAPGNDREIVELVMTLNELVQKERQQSEERIRDYAMLSHEIRTPIQSLLGHVDLAFSRDRTQDELTDILREVRRQTQRLHRLSEAVLLLQRRETSRPPAEVILKRLIQDSLESLAAMCEARQLVITSDLSDVSILANPEHVDMLVRNVVENAVRHAPAGSEISIHLCTDSFVLRNTLPVGGDRNPNAGSLLGLRICRALSERNHWEFSAGESGGEFVVAVRFPASSLLCLGDV